MRMGNLPKAQEAIVRALNVCKESGGTDVDVVAAAAAVLQAGEGSNG